MKKILICLLMSLSTSCIANASAMAWSCVSFDHLNRSYEGIGDSMRASMASARQTCIKKAASPSRCRVSHHWCKKGESPWLSAGCEAEDDSGKRFEGKGNNACELALNHCEQWQQKLSPSKRQNCAIIHR